MQKNKIGGVSIRKLNMLTAALSLLIAVALILSAVNNYLLSARIQGITADYVTAQQSARDMRSASDYLTEQARFFTVRADKTYVDNYFKESEETKTREKALEGLGEKFSDTEEYNDLKTAFSRSVNLMRREYYAMRLTIEAKGYDISEYPREIAETVLSAEDAALSASEKEEKARETVFGEEYDAEKSSITEKTDACLEKLVGALEEKQGEVGRKFRTMTITVLCLIIIFIACVFALITIVNTQIMGPLTAAIPDIKKDGKIPIKGASEFRFLARTYNKIYDDNRQSQERLAYEALHDGLTDILNRKGFENRLKAYRHTEIHTRE